MASIRWSRGRTIGKGAEGTVTLATTHNNFSIAVKSSLFSCSKSLQKEREFLNEFQDCSQIIRCFGADVTEEDNNILYNILLEYAIGGSLAHRIGKKSGLPDFEVKKYSKPILLGLRVVHGKGFVHGDIKPHNILLVGTEKRAKIADFGFASKVGIGSKKRKLRGTPMYMAPESVLDDEYGTPADIWAFGCTVFEMITGKKVWDCTGINDPLHLLCKIGMQSPDLHDDKMSKQAEDFLNKCVDRDPHSRWTADLLLNHPFLSSDNNDVHQRKRKELNLVDLCNSTELKPMKLLTNKRRRKLVERC
uniref:Fertilization-related kinase 2 n=1 Tax=Solanum chacoense TaxID=4108 RepID=Q6EE08_SOLCH|nr:fertilization-related kinase 2 [Solanum chacoense]